jgi:hypothetical protein
MRGFCPDRFKHEKITTKLDEPTQQRSCPGKVVIPINASQTDCPPFFFKEIK